MYKSNELFATLSLEDREATLNACVLTDKDEYTEDEMYRFKECRLLIEQGKKYDEVTEIFKQRGFIPNVEPQPTEPSTQAQVKKKKSKNDKEPKNLNISELLSLASSEVGTRISLIEAGLLLEACGLPDQEQYSDSEASQFLKACWLKTQGKSCEEIAAQFNVSSAVDDKPESDHLKQAAIQFANQIGDSATVAKLGVSHLIDLVTAKEAENLPEIVHNSFLRHASRKLDESKTHIEVFYAELEEHVIAQIEGKTQARSLPATWEWAQNSLPPSLPKPTSLLEESDSGTRNE